MSGRGSLTYQVTEALKGILRLGESKREAKRRQQQEILRATGTLLPLNQVQVGEIFSIKTMQVYTNMAIAFALWAREQYGIHYLTQLRMSEMGTRYLQERFIARQRSAWTIKTVLAALNKLAIAVERKWGCKKVGRIDRGALGKLPARRLQERLWAGEYEPEQAEAIVKWIADRRTPSAAAAALVLELQWRCGLRISEATGLRARMVLEGAGVLLITETTITKGGRDRLLPLPVPPPLLAKLTPYVEGARARGGPEATLFHIRADYIRRRVRQACKALGIERHGTHGFRHTFANDLYDQEKGAGASRDEAYQTVSEALGHSRPGITTTYVRE